MEAPPPGPLELLWQTPQLPMLFSDLAAPGKRTQVLVGLVIVRCLAGGDHGMRATVAGRTGEATVTRRVPVQRPYGIHLGNGST